MLNANLLYTFYGIKCMFGLMNQQLRTFYLVISDNKVVCFGTSIKELYTIFHGVEKRIGHYRTFLKRFKPSPKVFIEAFELTFDGKTYYFQKLV